MSIAASLTAPVLGGEWQYKSEGIAIPAATAGERVVPFGPDSVRAAVRYLDDGAVAWVRESECIACHTTGVYMSERVQLSSLLGPPREEVRKNFAAGVPAKPPAPANNLLKGYEAIWRSLGLATWDKHVTGKLSEETDRSLRDMLARQTPDGTWGRGGKVEIPYTTTAFERAVQAARALAAAPGWLDALSDDEMVRRVGRLKKALRDHKPRNDYERVLSCRPPRPSRVSSRRPRGTRR
jgi:hypothetical protein